jgi:DNA-binding NarL/FixJ family response regulator
VWRIVLILDEPDQRICAETLQACGMHVVVVGDPSDTREIGCDEGTVVVLDIGMFGASGVAILRRFVAEPPAMNALRILVLADWGEPAMERLVLRLGADAFLSKPVKPTQLLSVIQRLTAEPSALPSTAVRAAS